MFHKGDKVFNTNHQVHGEVVKVHYNLSENNGTLQNAYTVEVDGVYKVWLEKSDYIILSDEL